MTRKDDPDSGTTGDCATTDKSCSLREAINQANADASGDIVVLPPGTYTLSQPSSLVINTNMTLIGAGARRTTLDETNQDGVMKISGGTVMITSLTITGGHSVLTAGGAIEDTGTGTLTVKRSVVRANNALGGKFCIGPPPCTFVPGEGAGIYSDAPLVILDSTISGNIASAGTGSGADGGGIFALGSLTIVNSTIAGNSARGGSGSTAGGGIYLAGTSGQTLALANASIVSNTATGSVSSGGGNLFLQAAVTSAVKDSIIAAGAAGTGQNCSGTLTSQGYNLEDRSQCGLTGIGDLINTNPRLGPLKNNGGQTNTLALLAGSRALNSANPHGCTDPAGAPITTDQRGVARPQGKRCDRGAFEFQLPRLSGSPRISGKPQVGDKLTCLLPAVQSQDGQASSTVAWLRTGTRVASGKTYVLRSADRGRSLSCRMLVANAAGSVSATSKGVLVH